MTLIRLFFVFVLGLGAADAFAADAAEDVIDAIDGNVPELETAKAKKSGERHESPKEK